MEKITFVQKCLAKLNLNDEGKIGLAVDKIKSSYEKQIKAYERKISDTKQNETEKLLDMKEVLEELEVEKNEIFTTIDPEKIKTNDDRKSYIHYYTREVTTALNKVKSQKEEIENYQKQVESQIKEYQEQIDLFKELLTEMI